MEAAVVPYRGAGPCMAGSWSILGIPLDPCRAFLSSLSRMGWEQGTIALYNRVRASGADGSQIVCATTSQAKTLILPSRFGQCPTGFLWVDSAECHRSTHALTIPFLHVALATSDKG